MTKAVATREPVFVVGMNGSGTTMLLDCLGRHPHLYAFPKESRLIPWFIARQSAFGDLAVEANFLALWSAVRTSPIFKLVNGNAPVPLPADWATGERTVAAVLDAVFRHFAAAEGKRRWCEKTPQHVQHLATLAAAFPSAKFIHVIRDGRDCAASFHRRWKRQPELTIFRWKKVVAMGRAQGRALGPGRYLEARYEDITAQPERSLRRICAFLDLPFDPAVLESGQPYLATVTRAGLERNSGKWRTYFGDRKLRRLERIAGRSLAECGYGTALPHSDDDASAPLRTCWLLLESYREYSREIGLKLRGEIARPWRVILMKPVIALRHRQHNVY